MDPKDSVFDYSRINQVWNSDTKIVLGVDLGTTQSGVSFAFLVQGQVPSIHRVTHWPGQESRSTQSKIPTVVWYDSNMKAVSFGAEAFVPWVEDQAEDQGWALSKHFKLHLFPENMKARYNLRLGSLPLGVSLVQIYTDYLGYLLRQTKVFFEDRVIDGKRAWDQYSPSMEVVLTYPNGLGNREQAFLRMAAVNAGYCSSDNKATNVHFLTEAQASLYFCFKHTNLWSQVNAGTTVLVCDAGGSTVDIALCTIASKYPIPIVEEKYNPTCVQAGAIFIDQQLKQYLRRMLSNAGLPNEDIDDCVLHGVRDFECYTKRAFFDHSQSYRVSVGPSRLNIPSINIRRGILTLPGHIVKSFFDHCTESILTSVDELTKGMNITYILLVGGFGDSPYLRRVFQDRYGPLGCQVTLANDATSKAVSDGAVMWRILQPLQEHAMHESFGMEASVVFDHHDPEHQLRKLSSTTLGWAVLPGRWNGLIKKEDSLNANATVQVPYCLDSLSSSAQLQDFEVDVYGYLGDDEPIWMRNEKGDLLPMFRKVASIQAELESLRGALKPYISLGGVPEWQLEFSLCMRIVGQQLEAYLEWEEKGGMRTCLCAHIPV